MTNPAEDKQGPPPNEQRGAAEWIAAGSAVVSAGAAVYGAVQGQQPPAAPPEAAPPPPAPAPDAPPPADGD